jgi:glycosyltransferase involved in cell wall biosynthesis
MLIGDGPQEATGLGHIARDIGALIWTSFLDVELVQVGGSVPPLWRQWTHVPMGPVERGDDWGASYVQALWQDLFGSRPGILFVIWDPARCYAFTQVELPVQRWMYPAVDSHNRAGGLSGPPGAAVQAFDRVLAYTRWGSQVLKSVRHTPVPYLPHGLHLGAFEADAGGAAEDWVASQLGPYVGEAVVIGCVATNQPRKDLALYCETLATLTARGHRVYGWLHTDATTGAWSIDQLVADCGLRHQITVTLGTLSDAQLAALYRRCAVTIAPGLGEGFGYPIVESLAAGVPVVHGDFGGGAELVPKLEWRVPVRETRRESIYALTRPVFRADDVANAVERVLRWKTAVGHDVAAAYCRGCVAHLDWEQLGPRWTTWIREGLQ